MNNSANIACQASIGDEVYRSHSVRDRLDKRIAGLRQALERACNAKARAEALQMLDYPVRDLEQILWE
jgi:hypothetical protein